MAQIATYTVDVREAAVPFIRRQTGGDDFERWFSELEAEFAERVRAALERGTALAIARIGPAGVSFAQGVVPVRDGDLKRAIVWRQDGREGLVWAVTGRPALYYRRVAAGTLEPRMEGWLQRTARQMALDAIAQALEEAGV